MKDLWVPISGAIAQQRNVENIANNVANANTIGFKKDKLTFKEYMTVLDKGLTDIDLPNKEWAPEDFYRSYGAEHSMVEVDGSFTDHSQGQLVPTGNHLDLAIRGKGLFEVLTKNGIRFSRNGTLGVAPNGDLVTSQGHKVLSRIDPNNLTAEGAQIPSPEQRVIKVPQGKININLQGELFVNNQKVSELSVVEFKDLHALKKEGNSLFLNNDNKNIVMNKAESSVHQGFIEQSNVNAVQEMADLIKAHRQFESIQRVIKAYDNIAGRAVNDISRF